MMDTRFITVLFLKVEKHSGNLGTKVSNAIRISLKTGPSENLKHQKLELIYSTAAA